mmetsp:Transcript_22370/g.35922  ORF Transcript_22370/g.35922 Transcript_22370/m.35922 type:complete len:226 (-) Transcript_22370:349-1026(-)
MICLGEELAVLRKNLIHVWPPLRIFLQAALHQRHKVSIPSSPVDSWRVFLYDNLHNLQGMQPLVWRLSVGQLNGSDPKGPNVSLVIIAASLLEDLRSHPARRADERLPLLIVPQRSRNPEVRQVNLGISAEQNVARLQVPVYLHVVVEVLESFGGLSEDVSDDAFVLEAACACTGSHDVRARTSFKQWHDEPHLPLRREGDVVGDDILVSAHPHHLELAPDLFKT